MDLHKFTTQDLITLSFVALEDTPESGELIVIALFACSKGQSLICWMMLS